VKSFKIDRRIGMIYKSFESTRCFGVELETSKTLEADKIKSLLAASGRRVIVREDIRSKSNKSWHLKEDMSCGENANSCGWEVASYKGSGNDDILNIAKTAQNLKFYGLKTNSRCGLHVHVEVSDFNTATVGRLLARWLAAEPWFFNAVPAHRTYSPYCRRLSSVRHLEENRKYYGKDLWDVYEPVYLVKERAEYRRVALNICNFYMQQHLKNKTLCTVEFRLPEGSLQKCDVENWIRLFVTMVDTAKRDIRTHPIKAESLKEFLVAVGLAHQDDFAVLCPELRKTKMWLLKRILKYNFNRDAHSVYKELKNMTYPYKLAI
jgi:hypothetical protein